MHPQEGEVRLGKCPGLSCLHYSANPKLGILWGMWVGAETREGVSSLQRWGQTETCSLVPPCPAPPLPRDQRDLCLAQGQTQTFENNEMCPAHWGMPEGVVGEEL